MVIDRHTQIQRPSLAAHAPRVNNEHYNTGAMMSIYGVSMHICKHILNTGAVAGHYAIFLY